MEKAGQKSVLDYKWSQVFGFKGPHQKTNNDDIITALKFDTQGNYVAVGDKAGRIIVFKANQQRDGRLGYEYLAEFQSHPKQFDTLRSLQLKEEIKCIQWLQPQGKYSKMVTANERTIKLWKLFEKNNAKVTKSAGKDLSIPKLQRGGIDFVAENQKAFPKHHLTPINTLSKSYNQQYLLASDSSQILLWNFQKPEKAYILADISSKKNKGHQFGEITCSKYHPSSDSLFLYGSNKGLLQMADLRHCSNYQTSAISFGSPPPHKNYLYDLVSSYSSVDFIKAGKHVLTRDLLTVKIWDTCSPKKPLTCINLQDGLKSKLCEMAENDSIHDRFFVCSSPDNSHILTGSFSNFFHVVSTDDGRNAQYQLSYTKNTIVREVSKGMGAGRADYNKKIQVGDYNPKSNTLAVASMNCFLTYSL